MVVPDLVLGDLIFVVAEEDVRGVGAWGRMGDCRGGDEAGFEAGEFGGFEDGSDWTSVWKYSDGCGVLV